MAWPPTLPSTTDVANTTGMANRHPGDHNLIADALADLVTKVSALDAALPRGRLGHVKPVADQTGIGPTQVDLTGYSVSFSLAATRTLLITCALTTVNAGSTANQTILVSIDGGVTIISALGSVPANAVMMHTGIWVVQLGAGAHTVLLRGQCTVSSMSIANGTQKNGFMIVEDVGA